MEIQKTALYNYHKTLGAKFVPFAGYEMPIQYKEGIVREHISTRSYAGFFDVSHMGQFFLEGDNTLTNALEKIIPADLKSLKLNHSKYSFLLNKNGGIIDDLIITKTTKGFCIILNAACKDNDVKEISKFLSKDHKYFINSDLSLIALQGPKSVEILEKLIPGVSNLKFMTGNNFNLEGKNFYITRSGYTGEDGFEISISNNKVEKLIQFLIENKVQPIGLGARDTLRLEAGLCLYGHDLNEKTNPIEANLKWAIAKRRREEGGFNGWEKIKELIANGSDKKRVGILPEGRIIARESTKVFSEQGEEIGFITSGTFGPSVNASVAMGYINYKFAEVGTKIQLEVRGKKHVGKVSKLPFFKKSYVK
ncbi:glycine cleavage system aminomethyltransferase GcvT [Pelagibacteraceae bacterium]|nr:glycine cleavage system aminomethyltransferase GcvT [Pelagibacteraceae bacterium]